MRFALVKYVTAVAVTAAVSSFAFAETASFRVNGELITKDQQESIIQDFVARGQARSPRMEEAVKQMLIRQTVVLQEAKKQRLQNRSDVQREIENARKTILAQNLIRDYLMKNPVSQDQIKKTYEDQVARLGKDEVLVRHIVVKDEATAQNLLNQIQKGGDMAKLAAPNTIDSPVNKQNGGLIQWTSPKLFDTDFAAALSGLKAGQVCDHVVKTRLGYHVIKLEGTRTNPVLKDLTTATPFISRALQQREEQEYVESLVQKAKIADAASAPASSKKK